MNSEFGAEQWFGAWSETQPMLLFAAAALSTWYLVHVINRPHQQQTDVERKLEQALNTVRDLEEKLLSLEQHHLQRSGKKEIRIWMDGAFDMMHYGHMNAFRQGRALGTHLVVGVNSDETITACKGKPVCEERDRIATVRGCKWVDEVVEGVPYVMSDEYLAYVIEKYRIDYVVHGDDPCIVDGKDVYESAVKAGKYLTIPRTDGISTTDIVGRMLLLTRSHHEPNKPAIMNDSSPISRVDVRPISIASTAAAAAAAVDVELSNVEAATGNKSNDEDTNAAAVEFELASGRRHSFDVTAQHSSEASTSTAPPAAQPSAVAYRDAAVWRPFTRTSRFLTTSRILRLFGAGVQAPKSTDRIVYVAGAWDMFHAGHIEILEKARQCGDYVIVGVHNDNFVNQRRGLNFPIMNLHERVLSVMGCKFVDDVLIDAPRRISKELIVTLKIDVVVRGVFTSEQQSLENNFAAGCSSFDGEDELYAEAKQMGLLQEIHGGLRMSVFDMVERIKNQRDGFAEKYASKAKKEADFYKDKYNL